MSAMMTHNSATTARIIIIIVVVVIIITIRNIIHMVHSRKYIFYNSA